MRHYAVFAQHRANNEPPSSPMSVPSTAAPTPSPSVAEQQTPQSDVFDDISQRAESNVLGVPQLEGLHTGEEAVTLSHTNQDGPNDDEETAHTAEAAHIEEEVHSEDGSDGVDSSDDELDAVEDNFDESLLSTEQKLDLLSQRFSAMYTTVRAMRTVNLVFYRALAAKILKRLVSADAPRGESFAFRHLDVPLRQTVHSMFVPLGYTKYTRFSALADGVTNNRNNDVHFNKNFEASVREAKVSFPIIFGDGLHKPRYKIINDIFKLYDKLKLHFK